MATLFISDLHLCRERPEINTLFIRFLRERVPGSDALYVLGDLFEYWAGDDDLADPLHAEIGEALRQASDSGVPLYFMHGNRDFLVGDEFARATGVALLQDPIVVDLYGTPTLLMHGDTLCTDDVKYQAFRAQVRDPAWQNDFLAKPLAVRKAIIENVREQSTREMKEKSPEIMDVNPDAVVEAFRRSGCSRIIHGHTHRPAHHVHEVDGKSCKRWVLTDWYQRGGYMAVSATEWRALPL
ncbi:MAG: UDP-2,3-diacylglucosamine diphosphatase [Betaproteobacteria bacterium]|nr:UDP-2,3-diacylglucosamine diphosphatase [Betaproteobacteria bacterium]